MSAVLMLPVAAALQTHMVPLFLYCRKTAAEVSSIFNVNVFADSGLWNNWAATLCCCGQTRAAGLGDKNCYAMNNTNCSGM